MYRIDKRTEYEWENPGGASKEKPNAKGKASESSDGEQNTRPTQGVHRDLESGGEKIPDRPFTLWHLFRPKLASS